MAEASPVVEALASPAEGIRAVDDKVVAIPEAVIRVEAVEADRPGAAVAAADRRAATPMGSR